jgi:hypothetical protein
MIGWRALGALPLALVAPGCGGRVEMQAWDCPTGAETCPCYPNGTCDVGLTCASGMCVAGGGGSGGTSQSGGGSGGASQGGSAAIGACVPGDVAPCSGPGTCIGLRQCGTNGQWGECDCAAIFGGSGGLLPSGGTGAVTALGGTGGLGGVAGVGAVIVGGTAGATGGIAGATGGTAGATGGVAGVSGVAGSAAALPGGTGGIAGATGGTAGGPCTPDPDGALPIVVSDRFRPTGWIGDYHQLIMELASCPDPVPGGVGDCYTIGYAYNAATAIDGWAAIVWQYPDNNWGSVPGLCVEEGATNITFYARGERGGESVDFFGGGSLSLSTVLTTEWTEYTIDLAGIDYNTTSPTGGVCTGFGWAAVGEEPISFYIDDITWQ